MQITEIIQVCNKDLVAAFINQWRIITTRMEVNPDVFGIKTYHNMKNRELYDGVVEYYNTRASAEVAPWNRDILCPILLTAHGTDSNVAKAIATTGFAALSSLDAGYYGRGIYFTTLLNYTFPYLASKRNPCAILSWVVCGHYYPVIEHHLGDKTLMGAAIRPGYMSHFVMTEVTGSVYDQSLIEPRRICDEIVIPQECQVMPAFLLEINTDNFNHLANRWDREVFDVESKVRNSVKKKKILTDSQIVKLDESIMESTNEKRLSSVHINRSEDSYTYLRI